jgi:hypothetical protein
MGHENGDCAGNLFERAGLRFALATMEHKPAGGRDPAGAGMTGEDSLSSERVFLSGQSGKFGMEIGPSRKAKRSSSLP